MATATRTPQDFKVISTQRMRGDAARWRRFGEPVPAGSSLKGDGTRDDGIFGPDSVVWEVLLHPATIVFQYAFQGLLQSTYKPIVAGVRDRDPMSRKAGRGDMTFFDLFERGQRNSGMHAPMWLGDTTAAERMAKHLHTIHGKVRGDVIDAGEPEIGGYAASEPRDAMWAALTEMHSMLWLYENCAFRDGKLPHRLAPDKRDQFIAETAAYARLVGGNSEEIPATMADLNALYEEYSHLFGSGVDLYRIPDSGVDYAALMADNMKRNFHRSQLMSFVNAVVLDHGLFRQIAAGASSGHVRRAMGMSPARSRVAVGVTKGLLPLVWLLQRGPFERYYMRMMWGPDGVRLISSARALRAREAR